MMWFAFFVWVVVLQWGAFLIVRTDLRTHGLRLVDIGVDGLGKREWMILGTIAAAMAVFVVAVGDSTSARIVEGPWVFPRLLQEKLLMIVVAATAAVCEETIFRGYLFHGLRSMKFHTAAAVGVASTSFVFIHGFDQPTGLLA